MRPLFAAVAVLCVGLLAAGCGGESRAADPEEVLLQPLAAKGPDPFTASTALPTPAFAPPLVTAAPRSLSGAGTTLRTLSGSTPGLYAGAHAIASCDVEAQVRLVGGDQDKARAFAEGAGIDRADIPQFLRGLTSVVLRSDTRITGHSFRDGRATAYQAVLQTGTAVLVDQYGAPRVRCAGGNPLTPPVAVKRTVATKGDAWPGYRADRALVIKPAVQVVNNLLIVDTADGTWIERPAGTDGEEDTRPEVLPPVDPDEVFMDLTRSESAGSADQGASSGAVGPAGPDGGPSPQAPAPDVPAPDAPALQDAVPAPQSPAEPGHPVDEPFADVPQDPQGQFEPMPADPPVPDAEPQAPVEPDAVPPSADDNAPTPDDMAPARGDVAPDPYQG
ncbi:DUF6777 domain-containing protein [Streptomyces sp. V4I23]|uniref:DUF6777 domain-containing protein n=1 Tax=Streptomyces sp. V4I23 TaxID=3042282 RepID=UPI0027D88C23|nr:DUF6777 domain-containing protein [Streptomyces sp. V4I23]